MLVRGAPEGCPVVGVVRFQVQLAPVMSSHDTHISPARGRGKQESALKLEARVSSMRRRIAKINGQVRDIRMSKPQLSVHSDFQAAHVYASEGLEETLVNAHVSNGNGFNVHQRVELAPDVDISRAAPEGIVLREDQAHRAVVAQSMTPTPGLSSISSLMARGRVVRVGLCVAKFCILGVRTSGGSNQAYAHVHCTRVPNILVCKSSSLLVQRGLCAAAVARPCAVDEAACHDGVAVTRSPACRGQ